MARGRQEGRARGARGYLWVVSHSAGAASGGRKGQWQPTFMVGVQDILIGISQRKLIGNWRLASALWGAAIAGRVC